jgi:putative salt-induced outer membrane protein YdiY
MHRNRLSLRTARAWLSAIIALEMLVALTAARADDAAAADDKKPEPKKWEGVAAAGITLTRGNSKNLLATASFNATRKWEHDTLLFGANGGYGESTTKTDHHEDSGTTDQYLKGFGQFNHLFTERLYGGFRVSGDYDKVANLNYRLTVSPLLGYYFLKATNYFLSGEVGPSYVNEKFKDEKTHSYWAARAGERGEYTFKSGAKIWETAEIIPKVDEWDKYIVNAEAGVSAPISKTFDVRLVVQDSYNSKPAPERLKNDFKLIGAIGYHF